MPDPTAEQLLALGRAFTESRILLTAAELDLFTRLSARPLSPAEVTRQLHGDERAVTILLDALTALELLTKADGRYRCEPQLARLLAADQPSSVLPMLLHSAGMWHSWTELTGIARGDRQALERAQVPRGGGSQKAFVGAMHVVAGPRADAVVAAIRPGAARVLLDIGGASGTYTLAFLRACPQMRATLFDLPPVIEWARERCQQAGLLDRITLVGGDFYEDELPAGHDLALLSAIIHQNSPAQNIALYRKVCRALVPGGRLVIRDHIMSPDRLRPPRGAVFAVNMLVRTEGGNVYTLDECRAALEQAGFERVRQIQDSSDAMDGLLEAFRPAR